MIPVANKGRRTRGEGGRPALGKPGSNRSLVFQLTALFAVSVVGVVGVVGVFFLSTAVSLAGIDVEFERGEDAFRSLGRPFLSPSSSSSSSPDEATTTGDRDDGGNRDDERADYVRDRMMRHAWAGYETYAWGMDELKPIAKEGKLGVMGGFSGFNGMGATLVDAMSTLHVMGLREEFDRARDWVVEEMDFASRGHQQISFFETTIRLLGGLLSSYDLSGDRALLELAEDLADRLVAVFHGELSGIATNRASLPMTVVQSGETDVLLAEGFSNLIEWGTLGRRTGREEFSMKAEAGARFVHARNADKYVLGERVSRRTGRGGGVLTVAAPADSYYEYLLKYWILTGKKDDHWRDRWVNSVDEAMQTLRVTTDSGSYSFVGMRHDVRTGTVHPEVSHLGCFYPGNIALGVISGAVQGDKAAEYLDFARSHMSTCMMLYATKTGLGADTGTMDVHNEELRVSSGAYLQRPEVVESLFYLWRATHEPVWRQNGWDILQAIEKHCKVDGGYVGVRDVNADADSITPDDTQQSWFLAETLKYMYLLFEDDAFIDVADEWVMNTEAHPVRAATAGADRKVPDWIDWPYLRRTCTGPLCGALPLLQNFVSAIAVAFG